MSPELNIHAYEKLPLFSTGLLFGLLLLALHLFALLRAERSKQALLKAHEATRAGQILLGIDFLWIASLLFDADWNPMRMELFTFEPLRRYLLLLCPVIFFILSSMDKEELFPRALGLFLCLFAFVPMSAAFLQDPQTRILIPLICYPVVVAALFWVAKPYLFRDWAAAYVARPRLYRYSNIFGAAYGLLIVLCALLFW